MSDRSSPSRPQAVRPSARLLLGVLALSALCGCRATFRDPKVPAGSEHSKWSSFFLGGLIGHERVDIRDYCPSGRVHEVVTAEDAATLVVTLVTAGIYAPRRVYITCGKEKSR